MFDFALALAARAYGDIIAPRVRLATDHLAAYPQDGLRIAFAPRTNDEDEKWEPGARPPDRRVTLAIHINDFRLNDYVAIPYTLFHECFCHAFCGIPLATATSFMSDAFSEGWMELVAWPLLRKGLRSPEAQQRWRVLTERFEHRATQVSELRVDFERGAEASLYYSGVIAAKRMQLLFAGVADDDDKGFELLVDFSVRLNASAMSDSLRGEFVASVEHLLGEATNPIEALDLAPKAVQKAVKDYLVRHDAIALADKIIENSVI
jgi:hypothetical protein